MYGSNDEIFDLLRQSGVEVRSGKMICPRCEEKKLSASGKKGIAKCFGCDAFWTIHRDVPSAGEDWAIVLITRLAEQMQECVANCQSLRDWLRFRGLPKDEKWLVDNDLGVVHSGIDPKPVLAECERLLEMQDFRGQKQMDELTQQAKGKSGKDSAKLKTATERIQARLTDDRMSFEHMKNAIVPLLSEDCWDGAIVYIYRDEFGRPCSLNIRQYDSEPDERLIMRVQPRGRGLFGVKNTDYLTGDGWSSSIPSVIVVEGEHNLLALVANISKDVRFHLPIVAAGGKNGADINCLEAIAAGGEVLIIYDNDEIRDTTGKPGGWDLVVAVTEKMFCAAVTTPTKDLDDFLKVKKNASVAQVQRLLDSATRVPMAIATVRKELQYALTARDIEPNTREILVTDRLIKDLKLRCGLYQANGLAMLLVPGEHCAELIAVREGNEKFQSLMRQYGISTETWLKTCGRAINIAANEPSVKRCDVHSLAHWNGRELYVNCFDGSMVLITAEGSAAQMKRVPVGFNDVLMWQYAHSSTDSTAKIQPWMQPGEVEPTLQSGSLKLRDAELIDREIFQQISFASDAGAHKQMIKAFILSMFFSSRHLSKPMLMLVGPGGVGKSALATLIGTLLLGSKFRTTNAPSTPQEVAEFMTGTPFIAFDEWDTVSKPVENEYKHLSTGGTSKRRELYTTAKVVELACDATVIFTSNYNPLRQPGSSRRYFVVPVAPRQHAPGDAVFQSMGEHLVPRLMSARPAIWRELLGDLGACVVALNNTEASTRTSMSMADFGTFYLRIATFEGWADEAQRLLRFTEAAQEQQAAENQDLLEPFIELLVARPALVGVAKTAKDWAHLLRENVSSFDQRFKDKANPAYVSQILKTFSDLYLRRLGMTVTKNSHTKTNLYAFSGPRSAEAA